MSAPDETIRKRGSARRRGAAAAVLLGIAALSAYWITRPDSASLIRRAEAEFARGAYREALKLADRSLSRKPDDPNALIIAGDACFALDDYDRALGYYQKVPVGPSPQSVHAHFRCGRITMHHVGNPDLAERYFRKGLRYSPDNRNALYQLASLLGMQARRREAVPLILRLFRQGVFDHHFLSLLESDQNALHNVRELERYQRGAPESAGVLVGLAWHARRADDNKQARDLLQRAKDRDPQFAEARVALASVLWQMGNFGELETLLSEPPSRTIDDVRLWVVRGRLAERTGQTDAAIRCFGEALNRDQTNRVACYKLYRLLDDSPVRKAVQRRIRAIHTLRECFDLVTSKAHTDAAPLRRLVEQLERVGRIWEAWGWCQVALELSPDADWAKQGADRLHSDLRAAPLTIVCRRDPALNIDVSNRPRPHWNSHSSGAPSAGIQDRSRVTFRDDATAAGISFQYFNSPNTPGKGQRMFEFNGGGCAVLDFDNDGWPDLYFTQGCRWPADGDSHEYLDRLFRNLGNGRFAHVTRRGGLRENRFSTGVAVGDYDNDGFADLYVANIGRNRLFRNNGDGTFDDVTESSGTGDPGWSTSCVVADLNGDSLPDVYSVNYLEGPKVFETICKHDDGRPRMCLPFHYPGAQDQLYLNLGDGRFSNATAASGVRAADGKGLGVVVADWEGNGRLSLFVANDTVANFFFVSDRKRAGGSPAFRDRAMESGVALNRDGRAEACMGIAVGDADEDGDLDLFITNFYRATNTLYRAGPGLVFDDATRQSGLAQPGFAMLGFGTQFLDADLDGRLDLLVTNGHIDDYRPYGRPYKMPGQFFWNAGSGRFLEQHAKRLGPYFARKLLGRGMSRLDWNRDGRDDAVICHLDAPVALLTNTTPSAGRFLSLRLRGTQSARDAIGTTVVVRTNKRTITRQLTAGDGYQASNERKLVIGLSDSRVVPRLEIRWPSGARQSFENLAIDREFLFVEGVDRAFEIP